MKAEWKGSVLVFEMEKPGNKYYIVKNGFLGQGIDK